MGMGGEDGWTALVVLSTDGQVLDARAIPVYGQVSAEDVDQQLVARGLERVSDLTEHRDDKRQAEPVSVTVTARQLITPA